MKHATWWAVTITGWMLAALVAGAQGPSTPGADELFRRSGEDTPMNFGSVPSNCVFDVVNDGTNHLLVAIEPAAQVAVSPRIVRLAPHARQAVNLRIAVGNREPIPLFYSVAQSPSPFTTHTNRYRAYADGETVMCVPVPPPNFTSMLFRAENIVNGSKALVTDGAMPDNTYIYTPGPFYRSAGLFARDFLYQLEGSGRYSVSAEEVKRGVDFLALKQLTTNRVVGAYTYAKGAIPDHVYPDGRWSWGPGLFYGDVTGHFRRPSMDEAMCFITLAWHYGYKAGWDAAWQAWFTARAQCFVDAWNSVPRNPGTGLVTQWTTPGHIGAQGISETNGACVMWGFHDSYGFGGDDLGTSVLACNAARALADMYQHAADAANCQAWEATANAMRDSIRAQFNPAGYLPWGLGVAAPTMASPDITGYAVWSGILSDAQAEAASDWFAARYLADKAAGGAADLFHMAAPFRGAVRMARKADDVHPGSHVWPHMSGEHWENLAYGYNAYQDGGYWYYMSLGIGAALARKHPDLAREWVGTAYADLAGADDTHPYERIDGNTPQNNKYNASVGPLLGMGLPAVTSSLLVTVRNNEPAIENLPATSITTNSASLNGYLASTGTLQTAVSVYWGPADGMTNAMSWSHTNGLGTAAAEGVTNTIHVTGLASGTTYYYNFYAANASGGVWAATAGSQSFTTYGPPTCTVSAATGIGEGEATLNGTLVNTNGYPATFFFCYGSGASDFGTSSTGAWPNVVNCGLATNNQPFSIQFTGLTYGLRYWYRAWATNAAGAAWSGPASFLMVEAPVYRMPITFAGYTNRQDTLTNFPVLVVLSNNVGGSGFSYAGFATPNGNDLRFGTTPADKSLEYEIESWNTNGSSHVWVRVPTLPGNGLGRIYARWGDPADSTPMAGTTNGAVWANGFAWVSHLNGNARDATAGANHASLTGTLDADGQVSRGRRFNGTSEYAAISSSPALPVGAGGTLHLWAQCANWATTTDYYLLGNHLGFASANSVYFSLHHAVGLHMRYGGLTQTGNNYASTTHTRSFLANSWHHLVGTWTNNGATTTLALYADGTPVATATAGLAISLPSSPWDIARQLATPPDQNYFAGNLDEARISSVARSADWIWAEYQNIASNATFNAFGPVTSPPAPPAAPSGLVAVSVTTNQIQLAWTDNATTETGYVVERSPTWAATLLPANATNYTDTGLAASTLYDYRVAATNAAGRSAYATISTSTLTPWTQWQQEKFGAQAGQPEVAGSQADPDGDGMVNLLEYALRGNPLQADLVLPVAQRASDHLRLTYRQNKAATDLTYQVQGRNSLTLGDWEPINNEISRVDQDGYWEVTVEDTVEMHTVPSRFLRLKISKP